MGGSFLGFLGEACEPIARRHGFGVQRNAAHHHGDAGDQAPGLQFELILVLAKVDGNACNFSGFGKKTFALLHRHEIGQGFLQAQCEGGKIALRVGGKTPQPGGLHVEIEVAAAHFWTARALTPCMPRTSLLRTSASFCSRAASPAATSRSMSMTSFMVAMASSATWAST